MIAFVTKQGYSIRHAAEAMEGWQINLRQMGAPIPSGKGKVYAHLTISADIVTDIKEKTANGEKYLPVFSIDIINENNETVCRVDKTLYIKKR